MLTLSEIRLEVEFKTIWQTVLFFSANGFRSTSLVFLHWKKETFAKLIWILLTILFLIKLTWLVI